MLEIAPRVQVYVPAEPFGVFGGLLPVDFYRTVEALPREMRYFGGIRRNDVRTGSLWPQASFVAVDEFRIAAGDGTTNVAFGPDGKELYVTVVKDPNDPQAKGSIVRIPNVE